MSANEDLLLVAHAWRSDAAVLRSYGDERGAAICEKHAEEVERLRLEKNDELLTLQRAASEIGYSIDHLGRLVREGKLPNRGRRHAPRVRRGDLPPARARGLADPEMQPYDPAADARTLRSRQGRTLDGA